MPFLWPDIITYLEAYKPIIVTKRVAWQFPYNGWYMCNTCGASRDNPSPSATGFCVRDSVGDLVYARAQQLEETTNIVVEAKAIRDGLHYYMEHDLHPLILETDSPGIKKIIEGEWDPPWCIMAEVNRIKQMKEEFNFHSFFELPSAVRRLINMDKSQIPNLRVRIAKRKAPD
ncbi:uncharacterized protein LOC107826004 [Nicotiana tabacum]|uniref:Uncharacterized protein LOC107826004 n=1 Tax=Nicotiana tabacum TaxID=4097 RepID=A0A1S4D4R7_TOBAC